MSAVHVDPVQLPVTGLPAGTSTGNTTSPPGRRDDPAASDVEIAAPPTDHTDAPAPHTTMATTTSAPEPPATLDPPLTIDGIVRDHSAAMYRVALSMMRDHSLAEDVVQESVVKAWQALASFRGEASVRTWLLRITHNTAVSALRKRRDDVISPHQMPERPVHTTPHHLPEESALLQADRDEIWQALSRLDPVGRAIVVLREVDRMSYEEIASILDLPTATVRTRLFRARQQLVRNATARERLAAQPGHDPDLDGRADHGGAA